MIEIVNKKDCCGCTACVAVCPKTCIALTADHEGFLYPIVDMAICIDCNLCEEVCPVINQGVERRPSATYAAMNNNDEIRMSSSSGGVFSTLAEYTIAKKGVVFGVGFNDIWEVEHQFTDKLSELRFFRGSKYVQSKLGNSYSKVKEFLKTGRQVLFSGTPCQVDGLKRYLRREYENLTTVDFICHGVPSPKVFRKYLVEESLINKFKFTDISAIKFRDKREGWRKFSLTIEDIHGDTLSSNNLLENRFLQGFLKDIYLRPSCHACPSKSFKSGSDFTIADYWGIENFSPQFDDDKGVSLIFLTSKKALDIFRTLDLNCIVSNYEDAIKYNPSAKISVPVPKGRPSFFKKIDKKALIPLIDKYIKDDLFLILKAKLKQYVKKIIGIIK